MKPTYLTVKKVIEVEESYTVSQQRGVGCNDVKLKHGLQNGDLTLVQSTYEPIVWVVNKYGERICVLEKDGGCGPSEELTVTAHADY